jgi:hypothetical protein
MIGVAFFAFSSYVCLAQAKKQEKELAAGPSERKDEFSVLRKTTTCPAQAKKQADVLTANPFELACKTTGMHARMIFATWGHCLRQMWFDTIADLLVKSLNRKPSLPSALEEWRQRREASAWIAIGTIYGFVFGTGCGFAAFAFSRTRIVMTRK